MNKRTTAQITRAMDTLETIADAACEELRIVEEKLTALQAQQDQLRAERYELEERRRDAWQAIDAMESLIPPAPRTTPETTVPDNECDSALSGLTSTGNYVAGLGWHYVEK